MFKFMFTYVSIKLWNFQRNEKYVNLGWLKLLANKLNKSWSFLCVSRIFITFAFANLITP